MNRITENTYLRNAGLPSRTLNILLRNKKKMGFVHIRGAEPLVQIKDLSHLTSIDLLNTRGCGKGILQQIKDLCELAGLEMLDQ